MIFHKKNFFLLCILILIFTTNVCKTVFCEEAGYSCEVVPLERNDISLHLDCVKKDNTIPLKQILLVHGSSFSSHEFDIYYQDYSLVRRLAREGYAVWRIDIAGYGQSETVEDGFMPDTAYAAEDGVLFNKDKTELVQFPAGPGLGAVPPVVGPVDERRIDV
jgi:pimeloyl-ACP methyl ester carboxylesterase